MCVLLTRRKSDHDNRPSKKGTMSYLYTFENFIFSCDLLLYTPLYTMP